MIQGEVNLGGNQALATGLAMTLVLLEVMPVGLGLDEGSQDGAVVLGFDVVGHEAAGCGHGYIAKGAKIEARVS